MSEFDMCDRIQELIPRLDDQSNFDVFPKNWTSMNHAMALSNPLIQYQSEECFDCPHNGKICGKPIELDGRSVLLIRMTQ